MAVDIPAIREIVERVCTRSDVLDACKRRDLGFVVRVLSAHGITQGQIAALTGITQGRLSEYKTGKRIATATSTFEGFADGLGLPAAPRRALGLAPEAAGSGPSDQAGERSADTAGASSGDVQPLLNNMSRASAVLVLSALRKIHRGYIEADQLMGSICITGAIGLQMPVIERACEVTGGVDRAEMLRFACRFTEFAGWAFQDAADLMYAMHWTDRALDYALELGDQRVIAYTLTQGNDRDGKP
jgi:transcriptional regulator with XRE-family HTH domain